MIYPLALVLGYLFGAFPSGAIVARLYGVDLTTRGSGKTGATNVLRTLGKGAAIGVFIADFLKGVIPVLLVRQFPGANPWVELLAAVGAVLGHSYSPFLGFKGGRGVVTGLAVTTVAAPPLMLVAFLVGAVIIGITRFVSLGSVVGATVGGLLLIGLAVVSQQPAWAVWGVLIAGFIDIAHRDNIQRLLAGTERKLGDRARPV
jgi:acyl phosphate:glycerol-3-phosphate acyltransferase